MPVSPWDPRWVRPAGVARGKKCWLLERDLDDPNRWWAAGGLELSGVAVGVDRGGRRRGIAGGRGGVFVVRPSTHACQPGNEQALVGSPVAALIKPSPTSTS